MQGKSKDELTIQSFVDQIERIMNENNKKMEISIENSDIVKESG